MTDVLPFQHVLVIGAQRAGTTSVQRYLKLHPNVHISTKTKEIHYFDLNYDRGPRWYASHFPAVAEMQGCHGRDSAVTCDSTPYYIFHPAAAARAHALLPDAKIIVLLRDPAARAISHYHHSVRKGYETLTLGEAIEAEPGRLAGEAERICADPTYRSFAHRQLSYVARGLYRDQLDNWLGLFRREQCLFLRSEDMFTSPDRFFSRLCNFIGVPYHPLPSYEAHNRGDYDPPDEEGEAQLRRIFELPNKRLAELLGAEFDFNRS